MRSLSDYKDKYREIASNLNLQGESVDLLVNLLANASYIEEVENITYARESMLETASFMNSKIVHCMNQMYSVFRGSCPRVIMRFKPDRALNFNLFNEISVSNNFKIYYLGYYDETSENKNTEGTESIAVDEGFVYAPLSINVSDIASDKSFIIIGLLAKEEVDMEWTIDSSNPYYVNCTASDLSNDMYAKISGELGFAPITRHFSDHVEFGKIFDLTLPDFGSRLYFSGVPGIGGKDGASTKLMAKYFKYTTLSDYNESELRKIKLKGAELVSLVDYKMPNDKLWLEVRGYDADDEITTGVLILDSNNRDSVISTHYKASKERYLNSIVRSNNDLSNLLLEMYPEKVKSTYYEWSNNKYIIYYVPNSGIKVTDEEFKAFNENRKGYFVGDIDIKQGTNYVATFSIKYSSIDTSIDINDEINEILSKYSNEFNVDLESKIPLIKTELSKLSNVKEISSVSVTYTTSGDGNKVNYSDIELHKSYFTINFNA